MTSRKPPKAEVEQVEEAHPAAHAPEEEGTEREKVEDPTTLLEFNQHIEQLVILFLERHIQGLEQRITDLELILTQHLQVKTSTPTPDPGEVPDYQQPDRDYSGVGAPWYQSPKG